MTEAELRRILDDLRQEQSDNLRYETKAAIVDFPASAAKTLCSFANMPGGGTILFGIDEKNNFEVTGVYDSKNCQNTLASYAQKEYTPPIIVEISMLTLDGKNVVIGIVHEAKKSLKPVKYKKTGSAYIRQYDSDFELSALDEKMFESNQGIVHYDEEPVPNSSAKDLNQKLIGDYIDNRKKYSTILKETNDEDILLQTGVLCYTGELSAAGLMALGKYPQQFFPNYTIKASNVKSSKTNDRTRAVNVRAFDGPVPIMLESALRWIFENSDEYTLDLDDGNVKRVGEYPTVTCRELIANSLIHRDLSPIAMIETITLKIEDNRLVLSNPGGLFGLTVNELGKSVSRTRNARLAEICQYVPAADNASIVEKLGSGIKKIFAEQDKYNFSRPRFLDGEIYFTAILNNGNRPQSPSIAPNRPQPSQKARDLMMEASIKLDRALSIIEIIERNPNTTQEKIGQELGLTVKQIRKIMKGMIDTNLIRKVGGKRYGQWEISQDSENESE